MIYSFIPLRSGSKSIPLKNIKSIAGKPLAQWVIDAANKSRSAITVVATDSDKISSQLKDCIFFERSAESASDTASSELVLLEFCRTLQPEDIVVFIQATSPLLTSNLIDEGISKILSKEYSSILSVVRQKRFIWEEHGITAYDYNNRPRRQDWKGYLVENGAFYISTARDILFSKCRISGKIGFVECPEETYYEIDEPSDWVVVESLLNLKNHRDL